MSDVAHSGAKDRRAAYRQRRKAAGDVSITTQITEADAKRIDAVRRPLSRAAFAREALKLFAAYLEHRNQSAEQAFFEFLQEDRT